MKVAQACHRGVWGVKNDQFSKSDNTLPEILIHSCGVVLLLSVSATLAQY